MSEHENEKKKVDLSDELEAIFAKVLSEHQEKVAALTPSEKADLKAEVEVLDAPHHLDVPEWPEEWSEAKRNRHTTKYLLDGGHGSSAWTQDQKLERLLLAYDYMVRTIVSALEKIDPDSTVVADYLAKLSPESGDGDLVTFLVAEPPAGQPEAEGLSDGDE